MIFDWTYLLVLPGLLLGMWAQAKVKSAYRKNSQVRSKLGRSASDVVSEMLARNGNNLVSFKQVPGELTDHYDSRNETIGLSENVYDSTSLAALGIAAHEAGHAMQKFSDYAPMTFRNAIVPVVNIGSKAYFPIFMLGIVFSWEPLLTIGILCFALSFVFALITLPVEFDASRRGVAMLVEGGYITQEEKPQVKSVLDAAALTYVAAAVSSLLQLIRLLIIKNARDRD